jgi:hypothetical protein
MPATTPPANPAVYFQYLEVFVDYASRFVVYGGASVGLAWIIFQKAAERWIDAHFAKRQKDFEHEQAKELQRVKARLDTVIQGSLKLQEREFKIIPEAWEHVSEAYHLACWLCSALQQYVSLRYMSAGELDEFLAKQEALWETQKQEIRNAASNQRDELWQDIDRRMRYNKVRGALAAADKLLKANSIFLPDQLREQFNKLVKVIWDALIAYEIGTDPHAGDRSLVGDARKKLQEDGEPLHQEIERAVRRRLLEQTQIADDTVQSLT